MTREEAAELIKNCGFNVEGTIHDELEMVVLEALQERPKGRWIEVPDKIWSHEFKCSCCGRSVYTMIGEKGVANWYPYCHCGADMRGEEE